MFRWLVIWKRSVSCVNEAPNKGPGLLRRRPLEKSTQRFLFLSVEFFILLLQTVAVLRTWLHSAVPLPQWMRVCLMCSWKVAVSKLLTVAVACNVVANEVGREGRGGLWGPKLVGHTLIDVEVHQFDYHTPHSISTLLFKSNSWFWVKLKDATPWKPPWPRNTKPPIEYGAAVRRCWDKEAPSLKKIISRLNNPSSIAASVLEVDALSIIWTYVEMTEIPQTSCSPNVLGNSPDFPQALFLAAFSANFLFLATLLNHSLSAAEIPDSGNGSQLSDVKSSILRHYSI